MEAFVLISGSHDTYAVRAICSSRERAEKLKLKAREAGQDWAALWREEDDDIYIEEWAMDELEGVQEPPLITAEVEQ